MPRYTNTGIRAAEKVKAFAAGFVVHKKDRWAGEPFILEPWQWEHIILPIYGNVDRRGKRKHTQALIGLPRYEGKSEILALMVMYHLFVERVQEGEAYVVASNERQAGIVFNTVKRMIQANPRLEAACDIFKREIWVKETGCVFKAMPADADSAQGFHPSFAAVDEVHVHKNHDLIEAMQSGMVARDNPLLVAITTAGKKRVGVLWDMLQGNIEEGRIPWAKQEGTYVYWIGAKDSDDPADPDVWRRCNPASWITDDMLRQQYEKLPLHAFERYHLNRFPTHSDAERAFTWEDWQKCKREPVVDPDRRSVLTIDGANKADTFAIVVAGKDGEDIHMEVYPFTEPDPQRGFYDLYEIEQFIVGLWNTRSIDRLALDPNRLLLLAQRLEREHSIPVETFAQTNALMCPAAAILREHIRAGTVRAGAARVVEEQVLNAIEAPRDPQGWRISKSTREEKIDIPIAMAMAAFLLETTDEVPSFAETGIYSIQL